MLYKNGKRARDFWDVLFLFYCSSIYFGGVFHKTINPPTLVGYLIIIADSNPTRAPEITVK